MKYEMLLPILSFILVGGFTCVFAEFAIDSSEPDTSYGNDEKTAEISKSSQKTNPSNYTTIKIPDWIRKNAKWWSLTRISDKDFASGLEYLFQHEVIQIPDSVQAEHGAYEKNLPGWLRQDAGWWSRRLLSDEEFAKSLKWMIVNGFIKI
jgi:hypothetical protein